MIYMKQAYFDIRYFDIRRLRGAAREGRRRSKHTQQDTLKIYIKNLIFIIETVYFTSQL